MCLQFSRIEMKPTMSQECCRVRARNRARVWVPCDNALAKAAAASQFSLPARDFTHEGLLGESFGGLTYAGVWWNISECHAGQFPQPGCSCWGLGYSSSCCWLCCRK